jgi:hypothetical protein
MSEVDGWITQPLFETETKPPPPFDAYAWIEQVRAQGCEPFLEEESAEGYGTFRVRRAKLLTDAQRAELDLHRLALGEALAGPRCVIEGCHQTAYYPIAGAHGSQSQNKSAESGDELETTIVARHRPRYCVRHVARWQQEGGEIG